MNSFRRDYLDKLLLQNKEYINGKVLDVGGKKEGKRGSFDISKLDVEVTFLNIDESTNPDILSSADIIPSVENTYNTIVATELLEYMPEPKKVIREFFRVVKEGGHAIISTPFLHPLHGDSWVDRFRFTSVSLKELVENSGFKVVSIIPMGSLGAVFFDIFKVAFGYAGKSRFKNLYLIILFSFKPFFKLLDRITINQKNYINTGYFIILKK